MVIPLGIAGGREGNGTHGARPDGVGRVNIFKKLNIGAKFKAHVVVVGGGAPVTMETGLRVVDTPCVAGNMLRQRTTFGNHVNNEKFGQPLKRQTMNARAEPVFDGPNGALDFANVAVGGNHIKVDGENGGTETVKLVVGMDSSDSETATVVQFDDSKDLFQDGGILADQARG
jgi:hypothetical protein